MNVLVLAHRTDQRDHKPMRAWWVDEVNSDRPFALADMAVAGFLRVVTNPRIFQVPTELDAALAFVDGLVDQATCVPVSAGERHWTIFREILSGADARGNLVPDAYLAAIAVENGATIATRDRGFARFPGVRWLDPLDARRSG